MNISVWLFVVLVVFAAIGVIFTGLIIFTIIDLIIYRMNYDRYLDEKYGNKEEK